ncbi:hypothetical protein Tco_0368767 [Tanacetum coccineum]
MYVEYLKEFWVTTEVEEETKTITFLLSWWDKPLSFTKDKFISAIGLPICRDAVPLPPKETIRAGLATLGLFDKDKPTLSSTVLSLIPLSGEVNADESTDKSLSRTTIQLHAKVTVATAGATKSLASESAEEQGNQPSTAKTEKVLDQNVEEEKDAEFVAMEEVAEE